MNSYLLSVFVVLCFGPCTVAREVYQRFTKVSAEVADETAKRLNGETEPPMMGDGLVQVTSRTRSWIQWLRRLLKALRKWCTSHPHEVKLGKCFASYFNIRIPGLRRYGKHQNEDQKEIEYPATMSNDFVFSRQSVVATRSSQKRSFRDNFLDKRFIFLVGNFFRDIRDRFRHYRDVIMRNNITICAWDYFWKKFWIWIDSTPDSRCKS